MNSLHIRNIPLFILLMFVSNIFQLDACPLILFKRKILKCYEVKPIDRLHYAFFQCICTKRFQHRTLLEGSASRELKKLIMNTFVFPFAHLLQNRMLQIKNIIISATVLILSVPKSQCAKGLVPGIALLGGGGTFEMWGLLGGS